MTFKQFAGNTQQFLITVLVLGALGWIMGWVAFTSAFSLLIKIGIGFLVTSAGLGMISTYFQPENWDTISIWTWMSAYLLQAGILMIMGVILIAPSFAFFPVFVVCLMLATNFGVGYAFSSGDLGDIVDAMFQ